MMTAHHALLPYRRMDRALGCFYGFIAGGALQLPIGPQISPLPGHGLECSLIGRPNDDGMMLLQLARVLILNADYKSDDACRAYSAVVQIGAYKMDGAVLSTKNWEEESGTAPTLFSGLLRSIPLGIWGAQRPMEAVADAARQDAMLTHPHPLYADASAVLAVSIAGAVSHMGTIDELYNRILDWGSANNINHDLMFCLGKATCVRPDSSGKSWQDHLFNVMHNAFWHLLQLGYPAFNDSFSCALMETASLFGTTHKNFSAQSAICGALLGALHGARSMPRLWLESIVDYIPLQDHKDAYGTLMSWPVSLRKLAYELLAQSQALGDKNKSQYRVRCFL